MWRSAPGDPGDPVPLTATALRIGEIAFAITTDEGVSLEAGDDPAYSSFIASAPVPDDEVIAVHVAARDPVLPFGATQIFDAGRSWTEHSAGDGYRIVAFGPPGGKVLVQARFDRLVSTVEVACAPHLVRAGRLYHPIRYPLDQLLLMHRLAAEGGAIVHCCAIAVGDAAVICPGVSGAGKTTLARQLVGQAGLEVLSDDRAVVRRSPDGYRVYGTPWPGEGGHAVNRGLPLAAIGFIEQGSPSAVRPTTLSDALKRISRVASVPWYDRVVGPQVFDGLADLCTRVPVAALRISADQSAVAAVLELADLGARG